MAIVPVIVTGLALALIGAHADRVVTDYAAPGGTFPRRERRVRRPRESRRVRSGFLGGHCVPPFGLTDECAYRARGDDVFARVHHPYSDGRRGRFDRTLALERGVRPSIKPDPEQVKSVADVSAYACRVLTDTGGEDKCVESSECSRHGGDGLRYPAAVDLECELRLRRGIALERRDVTAAGQSGQSGFVLECMVELVE